MTDKSAAKPVLNVPEKHLPIKPLTRQEMHDAAHARVSLITKEFTDGFNFLRHYPKSVTIFGGSRFDESSEYYKMARELGARIVDDTKYSVMTGGGPGIMEAANRGAFEAGGESLGLTIELPDHQVTNGYMTKHLDLYYFFSRKVCLSFSAEAYVFFPGGIGTLDEFFEILTLVQTHKIERVPIILIGSDFWKSVDALIKNEMITRHSIDSTDRLFYTITDDINKIIDIIKNAPVRNGIVFTHTIPHAAHGVTNNGENTLSSKTCIPCEKGGAPLTGEESVELLKELNGWKMFDDSRIEKIFEFKNFMEAMAFMDDVADLAEDEKHHPDMCIKDYKFVRISLSTHAVGGLSENDFILASKIDVL